MLLRRVVEHVKTQNWMAVVLDFFIVVIGVFIGIQAANWNDELQEQKQRSTSIDRLHSEAEASISYLRLRLGYYQRAAEARASVLGNAAQGSLEAVEHDDIVLAINYIAFYPSVSPPRSVYDEIISAGQFSEIGDKSVRNAISRYYSTLGQLDSAISFARTMSQQWQVWNHPAVSKEFDPGDESTQTRTVVDIEMALNDPLFVKYLQMGHSQQVLQMGIWEGTLAMAEQMCREISTHSGRECTTI